MSIKQLFISVAMLFAVPAFAQEPQAPADVNTKDFSQEIQLLKMADDLVAYGRQTQSALPLIQAVQIFQKLNVADEADKPANPFSESQLLADATKFADGNKSLLALIKETEKATRAGAYNEPLRYFRVIESGETISQQLYVEGNQYVQVLVDGQGEGVFSKDKDGNKTYSDLRLSVYDKKGNVVAADQTGGKNCVVTFISRTPNLTIAVQNVGKLSDNCIIYVSKTKLNY